MGYLGRAVDQGIGRALWFGGGADPERVAALVVGFAAERRADLWSGVGLAATYAGGASREDLARLPALAGVLRAHLAQGAAFAAAARTIAGNVTTHTEVAARTLAGAPAGELAQLALVHEPEPPVGVRPDMSTSGDIYEGWRARVRAALAMEEVA
jgi:hypothetical protein